MIREKNGGNKVLFSFQQGQTANDQTTNADSLALPILGKQISGFLLVSSSIEKPNWLRYFPCCLQTDLNTFLIISLNMLHSFC